jgi:parallel beta-helix repeat protein
MNNSSTTRDRRLKLLKFLSVVVSVLFVIAIVAFVVPNKNLIPNASGAILYVGGGGSGNYSTIQAAIDNASDGDTVFVYYVPWNYNEHILINKSISLIGKNYFGMRPIIDGGGNPQVVYVSDVNYFNMSWFEVINSGTGAGYSGIYIISSSNVNISNNKVRDNCYGISITLSSFINVQGNEIYGNLWGIKSSHSSNNTFINNSVHDQIKSGGVGGTGIHFSGCPYYNNKIIGNVVYNNDGEGIRLEDQTLADLHTFWNNSIISNTVYNHPINGITISLGTNNFIIDNIVHHNGLGSINPSSGIYISSSINNIISGNKVYNNEHGIMQILTFTNRFTENNIINNNTIYSNTDYGIYLSESNENIFHHNNLIDNTNQVYLDITNCFDNVWDDGMGEGNYWSDYTGIDMNGDSVGDTNIPHPFTDQGNGYYQLDRFPLMEPFQLLLPPIPPPILYISVSQDGKNITLYWDLPATQDFDPYLIYRSTEPNNFDFSTPWVNTLTDTEPGELVPIPDRTMWNDTNAAFPGNATNYEEHYYYIIRAFNNRGEVSSTSRTVGKWTKTFPKGVSTFSLPLEPLENLTIDNCLSDMNATYIKWMNQTTHTWMKHGEGSVNDTQMKMGKGYEVKFSNQTNYTFTGMSGTMISYDDDTGFLGFDPATEAKNLTVYVEPNGNVTLTWEEPASMNPGDWYEVYYSNTRDGFFGTFNMSYFLVCPQVYFGNNTTTHNGALANNPGTRLYYMVVPFNASGGRGASTYSIGIWTEEYLSQYDTIGVPLKLSNYQTADWYCDNIIGTAGINYYNVNTQRWSWHSTRMPVGAFDPILVMAEGYQISTFGATKFTFIGV